LNLTPKYLVVGVLGPVRGHKRAGLLCSGESRTTDGKDEQLI
jgi:hypothetical protein